MGTVEGGLSNGGMFGALPLPDGGAAWRLLLMHV